MSSIQTQNGHNHRPSYELIPSQGRDSILYRKHGFPDPLVRWHYHPEYELHLLTHSAGKAFVGDYIGNFYPGALFLVGPNVPHNWISYTEADEYYPERDQVVLFTHEMIAQARDVLPEFAQLDGLLLHAGSGIEFLGERDIEQAGRLIELIGASSGLEAFAHFIALVAGLARASDYRLLSGNQYLRVNGGEKNMQRVNQAVNYIFSHYREELSLEEVAAELHMHPTYFSRFFRRATGRRFVEFVNSLRINRACDLLTNSQAAVTAICFEVGFTNISNFNRHFMAFKGMTPSRYRKLAAVATSQD